MHDRGRSHRLAVLSGNSYGPDCLDTHTGRIWAKFAEYFSEVHVIARATDNRFHHLQDNAIQVHLVPQIDARMRTFAVTSWLTYPIFKRIAPTHAILQSPLFGGFAVSTFPNRRRMRVIQEIHGDYYFASNRSGHGFNHVIRPAIRRALREADVIRSLAPEMTEQILARFGADLAPRIVLSPPRVDTSLFHPGQTPVTTTAPRQMRLVTTGDVHPRKNQRGLINALHQTGRLEHLTVIGRDGESELWNDPVSREMCARGQLKVTGWSSHAEVAEHLRSADVYVHYSLSEAVPRAVLEAMATGLPVITTTAGYLWRDIADYGAGLAIDSTDSWELSRALDELSDADLRKGTGARGIRLAREKFEWNRVFDQYCEAILGGAN